MKSKFSTKQTLLLFLIVETLFLFIITFNSFSILYPGDKIYKAGTRWRPNPAWKGGLHTTFTLKRAFYFQNISYPNLSFEAKRNNVGYWANVTSGSNAEINIWQWFTSGSVVLEYTATGLFNTTLYVGSLGEPTVSGDDLHGFSDPYLWFITTPSSSQFVYILWDSYSFTFHGPYNETTGLMLDTGCQVTAYFTDGTTPESFEVKGTYNYATTHEPQYFHFELGAQDREYWLAEGDNGIDIYIFDNTLTDYTFQFMDLAGALDLYPFVTASRYVNGTLHVVEKRKVDMENKLSMSLINGVKYTIEVKDGANYVYGDLLMTSVTTVTLTLKGIEFPQEVILAFKYVRLYAERHNNLTSISMVYQDLENDTDHVDCTVKFRNGTVAYTSTQYSNNFNVTWTNANYNITYVVEMDSFHNHYGEINYRAVMYGGHSAAPWSLDFLGYIPGMKTSDLIPLFLIFCVATIFSRVNAETGAFMAVAVAMFLTWLGWISIAPGMLVMGLFFAILMGLVAKKRRVVEA